MAVSYRLILQSGAGAGTEFPLQKTDLLLGRDMSNDIVVNDPEVSRRHARLVLEGTTYRLEDLGSTNGTFIRGQRLAAPVLLRPGEIITIGEKVVLRYEVLSLDANATVAAPRGMNQGMPQTYAAPMTPQTPMAAPVPPQQYAPQPPMQQPVMQQPVQQPYAPMPAAPSYQQQPAAPARTQYQAAPKKKNSAVVALLIIAGILIVFCVIPWIIIEVTNSYCTLFPGIFNMLMAGACP